MPKKKKIDAVSGAANINNKVTGRDDFRAGIMKFIIPENKKGTGTGKYYKDLVNYYKGDNKYNYEYLKYSKYKPSISKDKNARYVAIDDPDFKNAIIDIYNNPESSINKQSAKKIGDKVKVIYHPKTEALGRFQISKGKDKDGEYLSYYDIYDIDAQKTADVLKASKSFEVYDRIYLNDNKKYGGTMKTKKQPALYNLQLNEDELYSLGGWLKENAGSLLSTAAGVGMSLVPGLQGIGLPMAVSGASGLLGSAVADKPEEIDYSDETVYPRNVGTKNMTPNVMHFKQGGDTKVAKVMREYKKDKLHSGSKKGPIVKSRKQAIAIALSEAGLSKYNDGGLMEIEGPSHEQGGVQLQQGIEVEGGETIKNNVVNSDSWIITQDIADNYGLPKKAVGKTPAQYSKIVENKYKGREGDPFALKSKELESNNISQMSAEIADMIGNKTNERGNIEAEPGFNGNKKPYYNLIKRLPEIYKNTQNKMVNALEPMYTEPLDFISDFYQNNITGAKNIAAGYNNIYANLLGLPDEAFIDKKPYTWQTNNDITPDDYPTSVDVGKKTTFDISAGQPIIKKSQGTGIAAGSKTSVPQVTVPRVPSESDYARANDTAFGDNQPIKIKSSEPSIFDRTRINAGTEPLTTMPSYNKDLKYNPTTDKSLSSLGNVDWKNVGQTAMGLAPMAVQAFMNARNKAEGYDKVKLPRLQFDDLNPQFIDPAYQVQQAQDAFATGNEQMSQVSKKDWLRRRIQSATEEGKATSGIRGATAAANTQLRNQAEQFNKEGQMRTNLANLQTTMQEEQINAGNKAAWQTSRDFGLSNLGTMFGEYARDTRLEDADERFKNRYLETFRQTGEPAGVGYDKEGIPYRTNTAGSPTINSEAFNNIKWTPNTEFGNEYRDPTNIQNNRWIGFDYRIPQLRRSGNTRWNPIYQKYEIVGG